MKVKFVNTASFFSATLLKPCIEIWQVFLNFFQNLAIENPFFLKSHFRNLNF
jgi:hypothetical protein